MGEKSHLFWYIDGVDNKDLDSNLLQNINNFNHSACLRYYYSNSEDKYYLADSSKFKWPFLAHGVAQKNNIFLQKANLLIKIFNKKDQTHFARQRSCLQKWNLRAKILAIADLNLGFKKQKKVKVKRKKRIKIIKI